MANSFVSESIITTKWDLLIPLIHDLLFRITKTILFSILISNAIQGYKEEFETAVTESKTDGRKVTFLGIIETKL